MEALLHARGLGFSSSTHAILEDIDLQSYPGEIFAITGPSGSGKSTLLQLLCRLLEPSQGELSYRGTPYQKFNPLQWRREITLVFQIPTLFGVTVQDDLFLADSFQAAPNSVFITQHREMASELLKSLHLDEKILKKPPAQLSVGEAQRISLARALWIRPQVLLLDEPTASLDPTSKTGIEAALLAKVKEGLSVVLVSHEERQVSELAQHGIELRHGRIVHRW